MRVEKTADILQDLLSPEGMNTSVRELVRALMAEFKGPAGLAKEIKADFDACPNGHANRIRIEQSIMGLLGNYGEDVGDSLNDPEQLEAMAKQLLGGGDGGVDAG
jgi:hypothetical protein